MVSPPSRECRRWRPAASSPATVFHAVQPCNKRLSAASRHKLIGPPESADCDEGETLSLLTGSCKDAASVFNDDCASPRPLHASRRTTLKVQKTLRD
ncbi:Hypothetical protein NTJ_00077 [Nesidiocoris tenuis]|uniref:Uncharacterized protein n=1 Tax=Nesidiocoris tenuis TaxID=355587 RepID=A0ABN7A7N6_9HEMI|nr:Hypothetical protein NTJ_00077 [Nesidiocoris tenuis]